MPDYARDTKLNLGTVIGTSPLTPQQLWGSALACAVSARNPVVIREIAAEADARLEPGVVVAAKAAASIMAMNNVYYRGRHLLGSPEYGSLPARLRMQIIGDPGVDKADFELWCLAASAVTGCGVCLESHEKALLGAGVGREAVHEALRVAAVIHASAVTLDAEEAFGQTLGHTLGQLLSQQGLGKAPSQGRNGAPG
jgi:alkyl hydroperoxide reductase subunit D